MKQSMSLLAFCMVAFAPLAGAYEYPLQFKPNAGYRNLVVAGYKFEGTDVVGNCSYDTVSGHSGGKGGGGTPGGKSYKQTCKWDLAGNLQSITPGELPKPTPLYTKGSQVVYAMNAQGDITGTDTKVPERGFVSSPGSHYTWLTPNNSAVLQKLVYTHMVTLESDGDTPVNITNVTPSALHGIVTLKSTNCIGQIKVGATCNITVTYDPTKLTSTTGVVSDTLRIDLTSNAGEAHDFIQNYTIVLPH